MSGSHAGETRTGVHQDERLSEGTRVLVRASDGESSSGRVHINFTSSIFNIIFSRSGKKRGKGETKWTRPTQNTGRN